MNEQEKIKFLMKIIEYLLVYREGTSQYKQAVEDYNYFKKNEYKGVLHG